MTNPKTAFQISTTTLIIVLGCLNGLMPFSTDLYLPAFPEIAQNLHTTTNIITLSMSTFFAGACFGQFINGPILDRFGRKNPMLIALATYTLASIGCSLAPNIETLCILRFFQAISISMCSVGSRATVRDAFPVEKTADIFSTLALVMGVAPIIAPSLGSIILLMHNWRVIFIVLSLMSLTLFFVIHFLFPHFKTADKTYSLKPKAILNNYKAVLQTPGFIGYTFVTALASGALFSWISNSSYIFIELLQLTEQQFGWVFAGTASCLILGSQLNRLLLKKFSSKQIALAAACIQLCICVGFLYFIDSSFTVKNMIIGMCLFMLFLSMITPNTMALTLAGFSKNIGSATAIMGGSQMAFSAVITLILSQFHNGTAFPMLITISILSAISAFAQFILKQKKT